MILLKRDRTEYKMSLPQKGSSPNPRAETVSTSGHNGHRTSGLVVIKERAERIVVYCFLRLELSIWPSSFFLASRHYGTLRCSPVAFIFMHSYVRFTVHILKSYVR